MARMPQEDPFAMIYRGARELKAAEESKDLARLKTLDFAVGPQASLIFNIKFWRLIILLAVYTML
jgi:hypothetical protein